MVDKKEIIETIAFLKKEWEWNEKEFFNFESIKDNAPFDEHYRILHTFISESGPVKYTKLVLNQKQDVQEAIKILKEYVSFRTGSIPDAIRTLLEHAETK